MPTGTSILHNTLMDAQPPPGGKKKIIHDTATNVLVELPFGIYDIVVGREAYDGLPVPILPDRKRGDGWRLKETLRDRVGKLMAGVINTISRHHAIVYVRGDTVSARDAGSTEGTKVNGEGIKGSDKRPLANGDKLQLSAWELVYWDDTKDLERISGKKPGTYRLDITRLGVEGG
jgi:hypothetical protein